MTNSGDRDEVAAHVQCWICGAHAEPTAPLIDFGYWTCPVCGFIFQAERDSAKLEAARYVESYFDDYDSHLASGGPYDSDPIQRKYEAAQRVAFLKKCIPYGSLMEVGAASGHFVAAARSAGYQASGIEPSPEMARRARETYGVDVQPATLAEIAAGHQRYDAVCAWHVLEHLPAPRSSLQQMLGLLRPGGRLFLELPNVGSVRAKRDCLDWSQLDPDNHVSHYEAATLRRLLSDSGFEEIDVATVSFRTYARSRFLRAALALADFARFGLMGMRHPTRHELLRAVARRPA